MFRHGAVQILEADNSSQGLYPYVNIRKAALRITSSMSFQKKQSACVFPLLFWLSKLFCHWQ